MWSFRVIVAVFALLLPGACGFHSLYGTAGPGSGPDELAAIRISPIADRVGQQLHNHLLDLLNPRGRPAHPRYVLDVALKQSTSRLAVERDAFATRANLRLAASFVLHDPQSGKRLVSGESSVVSSYNIVDSEFATLMAERDAKARATREIANDIRARLAAYFLHPGGGDGGK